MDLLDGKVVLVDGGGRGVGAVARAAAHEGAPFAVTVTGRRPGPGEAVAAEPTGPGAKAQSLGTADLSDGIADFVVLLSDRGGSSAARSSTGTRTSSAYATDLPRPAPDAPILRPSTEQPDPPPHPATDPRRRTPQRPTSRATHPAQHRST